MNEKTSSFHIEGVVWKYGDHINTDVIIPARYLNTIDSNELAVYCMADLDESFASLVQKGDIIVAGENFGCGSSREHAPLAIKAAGTSCIIAASFARIFFRNAINIGLPLIEDSRASKEISRGDRLRIEIKQGVIENLSTSKRYQAKLFSSVIQEIIDAGGLMSYIVRQNLASSKVRTSF